MKHKKIRIFLKNISLFGFFGVTLFVFFYTSNVFAADYSSTSISNAFKAYVAPVTTPPPTINPTPVISKPAASPIVYVAAPAISNATLTSLLRNLLQQKEFSDQLRGPQGPAGPQGTSGGNSGMYVSQPAASSQPSAPTQNPVVFLPVGATYADSSHNFGGGTYASITNLTSNLFTNNTSNITTLNVSGSTALAGNLSVTGTATIPNLSVTTGALDTLAIGGGYGSTGTSISNTGDVSTNGNLVVDGGTTFSGTTNVNGQAVLGHVPTLPHMFSPSWPLGTSNVADSTLYINPSSSVASGNLIGAAVNGSVKFVVDSDGNIYANNVILTGSSVSGSTTHSSLTVLDNTTLGDANADILTINGNPINLGGSAPVINATNGSATLGINTTTNRPVTFGSGLVTIPNISATTSSLGAITATGITSSGTITLSGLSTAGVVLNNSSGVLSTLAGTSTTVLHGNAGGAPTYGAVALTTDVSGVLPVANGGTGVSTGYTFSTGLTNTSGTITNNLSTGISGGQTVIGGTGVTDALSLKGTTGNGTLTATAIQALVGNNGGTNAMTILNNGNVGIGVTNPSQLLSVAGNGYFTGGLGVGVENTTAGTIKAVSTGNANNQNTFQNTTSGTAAATAVSILNDVGGTFSSTVYSSGFTTANGNVANGVRMRTSSALVGGLTIGTGANSPLIFYTTDSERMRIDGSGNVGIGTIAPAGLLHVSSDTAALGQTYFTQANASSDGFDVNFRKARGTAASPTVITTADELGVMNFTGYGGASGYMTGAAIKAISSGTIADTRIPAQLSFWTGTDATPSVLTERMTILNSGNVGVGTTAPLKTLDVAGGGRFTGKASSTLTGTASINGTTTVTGTSTLFTTELVVGDRIIINAETVTVITIASNTSLTVNPTFTTTTSGASITRLHSILLARDSSNNVKFTINDLGTVGIGTSFPAGLLDVATGTTNQGQVYLTQASSDSDGFDLNFRKARISLSSPNLVHNDDLGLINFQGHGGTAGYITAAAIKAFSSGTQDNNRVPGQLSFWTATDAQPSVLTQRMTILDNGNIKIAGTASRVTTEGTNHLDIFDGVAPVGTLANGISLYSTSGELRVMDAAGNATILSPHDLVTNDWVYDSVNVDKGKTLLIDMEQMMKKLNGTFGWDYVHETLNGVTLPDTTTPLILPDTFVSAITTKLVTWMADIGNGIGDFFANRVHTKQLCISDDSGETCITRSQLNALLAGAGAAEQPLVTGGPGANSGGGNTPSDTAPVITLTGDSTVTPPPSDPTPPVDSTPTP